MISAREARRRMGRLLTSDNIQARLARLPVDVGEFCADVIEAYTTSEEVCRLEASEVLAVCEMAATLGLSVAPEGGQARLTACRGRAGLLLSFSGLHRLVRARMNP